MSLLMNIKRDLFGFFLLFVKIKNNSFLPYKALMKVPYILIIFLATMEYYLLRKSQPAFPFFFLSIVTMTTIEFW